MSGTTTRRPKLDPNIVAQALYMAADINYTQLKSYRDAEFR